LIAEERLMSLNKFSKVWLTAILLVTLSACLPSREVVPTPTPLPPPVGYEKTVYTVERGPIVSQFSITGKVLPSRQEELFFRSTGYVSRVTVAEGDMVQKGDLLAELQVDDLVKQLEQAYIDLEVAQAQLADEERPRRFAIARAEHQVAIRQIQVDLARAALAQDAEHSDDQAELSQTIAEEQLARLQSQQDDYDTGVLIASVNLEQAQETLNQAQIEYQESLDRPWEKEEVRDRYAHALQQAEWNYSVAQARYDQALAAKDVYQHDLKILELAIAQEEAKAAQDQTSNQTALELQLKLAEENLALAKLDLEELSEEVNSSQEQAIERSQLAVERLQAQLADRQVISPFDGIVLNVSGRAIRPGDAVEAFEPVLIIGDPTELVIGVRRSDERTRDIQEDHEIHMSLSREGTETFDARLMTGFFPFGDSEDTEFTGQSLVYFEMLSAPERDQIPVGKTVYLTIVVGRNDDALLLPPATIRSFRGRDFVIVQDGDRQRRVDVQLGLETDERVEVTGNLAQGDQVVGP
jgi:multidrug efflux pump subunit AcrA (membrane-fusion protein)